MAKFRYHIVFSICCLFIGTISGKSQGNSFVSDSDLDKYRMLFSHYSNNKELPKGYEKEALIALSHFPELKDTHIKFQLRETHSTLKTRVNWFSMLGSRNKRQYVITISTKSSKSLEPILFEKMTEEQRIGILGHELSHVADFEKKNFTQCLVFGVSHISPSYVDSLEYHTDKICVEHGLGRELEAWSFFVRQKMQREYWRGADYVLDTNNQIERYMNPSSIEKEMQSSSVK